ncbi:MAG: GNAT family N-acetyltransferase [Lachnospiraceae bacterium]|nr:GNAT family N-acetyltransferase [Lachnospiraceae bacterium]
MKIRRAVKGDIDRILAMLSQILELHAALRPDIFVPGTTKYTAGDLETMLQDDRKPIYVAADEEDTAVGYVFCQIREQPFTNTMVPFKSFFIDDLCVDAPMRGQHIGEQLFEYAKQEAARLGCYEVTLNVWQGNDAAERFYEKMGMKTKERQMELILQ